MYGLVLEGGGARGSYHMGAYKAIKAEGLEIGAIAGTSIGAINGAMIVQGDFERALELWQDISYSMVIDANDEEIKRLKNKKLDRNDLRLLSDKLKAVINDRGFDITPLKELLNQYIDEDRIRASNMDFGLVTVNLSDLKSIEIFKEDIPKGEMKDYILASAYLPAFKSEKLKGKRFLDGAFYDNLPFTMLKKRGYKDLILVRTHARGITRKINPDMDPIVVTPSDDIGQTFEFEHERAKRNIELGYYDALRAIRGLKGRKYYIEPIGEDFAFNLLITLNSEQLTSLGKIIKTHNIPHLRELLEYIVPKLGSQMGLSKTFTYEDFIISLLEKKAESLNINRFQIYKYNELLELAKCTPSNRNERLSEYSTLGKLIDKVDLSAIFNKEETILNLANIILCKYNIV
ncbi:patatin-like phospholipase family protein [Tissierella creatinini]|nr:patatin-like phospholipase family protein [Tissierella creatinini]TJX63929.1 patatin-like phospholipase family protein [Soehngenia saccharolytica]